MKYELTEGEFIALLDTVKSLAKSLAKLVKPKKGTVSRHRVREMVTDAVREHLDGAEDGDEEEGGAEEGGAEDEAEAAPTASVTPFRVVAPAETPDTHAAEEKRVKALHGKDQWIALVEVWRKNFGIADAPQPDRVANLTVALNPFVAVYLSQRDGLTHATREAIYLLDGGDPEAATWTLTAPQVRESRLLAENIAQVASFHAPEIAEQLEYAYKYRTLPAIHPIED